MDKLRQAVGVRTILKSEYDKIIDGEEGWVKVPVPPELIPKGRWRHMCAARSSTGKVVVLGVEDSPETEDWPHCGQYYILKVV